MGNKKMSKKSFMVLLVLSLMMFGSSFAIADDYMSVHVRPLPLAINTIVDYQFNFTSDSSCSNVLFSDSLSITTDTLGVGAGSVNISDFSGTIPSYICEYRDGVFRSSSPVTSAFYDNIYVNKVVSNDWSNVTISESQINDLDSSTAWSSSFNRDSFDFSYGINYTSATTSYSNVIQLTNGNIVIAHKNNTGVGILTICDINGSNCVDNDFSGGNTTAWIDVIQLSNGNISVAYRDDSESSKGKISICDIDGNNCDINIFNTGASYFLKQIELNNNDIAIAYTDGGNSEYGTFAICDIDGTNCVENVFDSAISYYNSVAQLPNGSIIVAYNDGGNSNYGTFAICDIDGTNCVKKVFNTGSTSYTSINLLSTNKIVVGYKDEGNSNYGTFAICDIDGTNCVENIYASTNTNFNSFNTVVTDLDSIIISYIDVTNSNVIKVVTCNSKGLNCVITDTGYTSNTYTSLAQLDNNNVAVVFKDSSNNVGSLVFLDYVGLQSTYSDDFIGLGTASPSYKLDVNGSISATDYYGSDGSQGMTGSCGSSTTLTIVDGLIISCS